MRRPIISLPKPKPDKALYADFLAAVMRVVETEQPVLTHGYRIMPPKRRGCPTLTVEAPRTMRDRWDGSLITVTSIRGGSGLQPKKLATMLAFDLMADRSRRAELVAEASPGIWPGTATHIAEQGA